MNRGEVLATALIEGTPEEEAKANELVAKWDRAHASYQELAKLEKQRHEIFKELGASIGVYRELAKLGLKREDVLHFIRGDQVGATDNYKREMPVKLCMNSWCGLYRKHQPIEMEDCPDCKEKLSATTVRTTPSDLRKKFHNFTVGAELKDGGRVWFKDPVPHKSAY